MIFKGFFNVSVALCFLLKAVSSAHVLVPLYANPTDASFQSYIDSFAANPTVKYKVIINPSSGPGTGAYPNAQWIAAVAKIRPFTNVQLLGYVHTTSATRPITAVTADITTYANWYTYLPANISMDGIFFDEAPNIWTVAAGTYMTTAVTEAALTFQLSPYIYFNPGVPTDVRFYSLASSILVWENSYSAFEMYAIAATIPILYASKSTVMIHDFPSPSKSSTSVADQAKAVQSLKTYGISGIFISDQSVYSDISSIWSQFCKAIAG